MSFMDENQDIEMVKKEDEIRTRHPVYEEDENVLEDEPQPPQMAEVENPKPEEESEPRKLVRGSEVTSLHFSKPLLEKFRTHHILSLETLQTYSRRQLAQALGIGSALANQVGIIMSKAGYKLPKDERIYKHLLHWTQTPEGRKKLSLRMKSNRLAAKKKKKIVDAPGVRVSKRTSLSHPLLPPKVEALLMKHGITTVAEAQTYTLSELGRKIGNRYFAAIVNKKLKAAGFPLTIGRRGKRAEDYKKSLPLAKIPQEATQQNVPEQAPETQFGNKEEDFDRKEYLGYIVGFAHCDIQARIHQFAASTGGKVTEQDLSYRLGELLLGEEMRQVLGTENRLPSVR